MKADPSAAGSVPPTRRALRTALVLMLGVALAGCSSVEPWERGNLAKPQMAPQPHPAQRAMQEQIYRSREASGTPASAQGGGCGCY